MPSLYPTEGDLSEFLSLSGISIAPGVQLGAAIRAGITYVENRTGRHFLAGRDIKNNLIGDETRYFDPPVAYDPLLLFGANGDLASLTSVVYQPASSSPVTKTLNSDFWLIPEGAAARGRPYYGLRFKQRWWDPEFYSLFRAFQVTGSWGYSTSIPDDVWSAMLAAGAKRLKIFNTTGSGTTNLPFGVKRWIGPGGVSTEYDTSWLQTLRSAWQMDVDAVISNYQRWEL